MKKLIYIADDDENIRSLIEMFLKSEQYDVEVFPDGDSLYEAFCLRCPDLIVLDIMMPGSDGLTICNKIRDISAVPIILLSAKDSDVDQITGLTLGSDDYITKPFKPTLLIVRVKAILRRAEMSHALETPTQVDLVYGDLTYSPERHLILCNETELRLTGTEFNCLAYLIKHNDRAVSREDLLKDVWGYDCIVETRAVDETIRKVRRKLSEVKSLVGIANKWGYGYVLKKEEPWK